ncbi:MAG: phospho-sugar mutase, partial [Nannocystaceae bacterium]
MREQRLATVANLDLPPDMSATITRWLTGPRFASECEALESLVAQAGAGNKDALAELVDAFSGTLPIGTGGRRGKVGPGPNRFNRVVVRETAQGVADALNKFGDPRRVAIVYDTRRDSRDFAHVAAEQLVANGLSVLLLDVPRPTPELSFIARESGCGAGIVVSASHNPPADNGIKIYGPDGAQVLGLRDRELMGAILAVAGMETLPEASADDRARIEVVPLGEIEIAADRGYHAHVAAQGCVPGSLASTKLSVVFTPLHGVGHTSVVPVLRARGISVAPVDRQCDPDNGQFSTVESANPELPSSMAMAVELAKKHGADLVLATDPDADRLGACVHQDGEYIAVDGNRLGVLMLDHILANTTPADNAWVLTTLVTSPLVASMARSRGVTAVDDLLVGFKHHAGMMREHEDRPLLFACEESHGYMRGNAVRDKDGAVAALLLAGCASPAAAQDPAPANPADARDAKP